MRKYLARANQKMFVVIFGIVILAGLVLCPILIYRWRDSVRSEEQYKIAPQCAGPEQSGCRREIEAVVKDTHYTTGRNKTTYFVSLSMPGSNLNGDIPAWWETDHSLYSSLKPGDRVTAEEWEGQVVAIHVATGGMLRTEYDPTREREGFVTSLIAVPLVTVLLIFIEYKIVRGIRKEGLKRN
ncbi:MAG TPA: hypothetical protein VLL54_16305 [Pyrinomonadaceae bacterium]|nr:hypothetical protein [Pyrinomonadaceae bacterium]